MSREQIITTAEGRAKEPLWIYDYPKEAGTFIGVLTYRAWHPKGGCLLCYFDTDDGHYFKLAAWWKPDNNKTYRPRKSNINFADDVENSNRWKCSYVQARGGSMTWMTAESVE